jgi:hypothetical protein
MSRLKCFDTRPFPLLSLNLILRASNVFLTYEPSYELRVVSSLLATLCSLSTLLLVSGLEINSKILPLTIINLRHITPPQPQNLGVLR